MSEESEIIALYSPSKLEEGSELDVLFKGEMLRYEVHQHFVVNVRCVGIVGWRVGRLFAAWVCLFYRAKNQLRVSYALC